MEITGYEEKGIMVYPFKLEYDVKEWVSKFASVSRNKDASNNPELRYKLLLKETASGGPSRPLELEPVVINNKSNIISDKIMCYATAFEGHYVLLNRRAVLENPILEQYEMHSNIGPVKRLMETFIVIKATAPMWLWDNMTLSLPSNITTIAQSSRYTNALSLSITDKALIGYDVDDTHLGLNGLMLKAFIVGGNQGDVNRVFDNLVNKSFCPERIAIHREDSIEVVDDIIVIEIECPKYVADQLATHKMLSPKMSESYGIHYPKDLLQKTYTYSGDNHHIQEYARLTYSNFENDTYLFLNKLTLEEVFSFFKELGYPKEIYQRYPHHAKLVTLQLSAGQNDAAWEHFFKERGAIETGNSNHTQPITKTYVNKIYEMYKEAIPCVR